MPLEGELREGRPWVFDAAVAEGFDDMLERSIPEYETMRELTTLVASAFVRPGTLVVDLGCSRGEALAPIVELEGTEHVVFLGLEASPPMCAAAKRRFEDDGRVEILFHDLRDGLRPLLATPSSVVLSVLTLMFVPVNYRARLLAEVYESLTPGGALVLVEKVLSEPRLDDVFTANYHRRKTETGYTPDEIARKRLSLEGVLVPWMSEQYRDVLRKVGFREVDTFWRWFNFEGMVAVR